MWPGSPLCRNYMRNIMMKGYIMTQEAKCLKCGGTNIKPGVLQSTGKIYARPTEAKLLTALTTGAVVNSNICLDCGHVELVVNADKAGSLVKAS